MKEKTLRGAMSTVAIGLVALLSGCSNLDLLNSKGSVGIAERNLIATSTWAMLGSAPTRFPSRRLSIFIDAVPAQSQNIEYI